MGECWGGGTGEGSGVLDNMELEKAGLLAGVRMEYEWMTGRGSGDSQVLAVAKPILQLGAGAALAVQAEAIAEAETRA
eukprot:434340-Pleurochrysis_carterae.AAC.1